jgi:hydrogenase/urease accessory protein HupE
VFRPAYLELRQRDAERWDVLWKVPARSTGERLAIDVDFSGGVETTERRSARAGSAFVERWSIRRAGGLAGAGVAIAGLVGSAADVLVRVERLDGGAQMERLGPARASFTVAASATRGDVARSYLALGVEHILAGVDHLLFVLALLLVVRGARALVATITAFTVAHSATLAAATLGWVHVPQPPVEAAIALSIAFVAAEVVHGRRGRPGLTARAPWVVAFGFGLLHGLGFASALAEVGLPQHAIPLALVCFNVGVEIGQLAFVAAIGVLARLARAIPWTAPRWADVAPAYAIGAVAAFWTLERIASFTSY